MLDSDNKIIT